MTKIYENDIELWVIELLEKQGYTYLSPDDQEVERPDLHDVILRGRLEQAVARLRLEAEHVALLVVRQEGDLAERLAEIGAAFPQRRHLIEIELDAGTRGAK